MRKQREFHIVETGQAVDAKSLAEIFANMILSRAEDPESEAKTEVA